MKSKWETTELKYNTCKVYKDTIFGKRIKNGYILTEPLIYKHKEGVYFYLEEGFVWDGPSYPNFLSILVGERNTEALLAASAMHDSMKSIPTVNTIRNKTKFRKINIKRGAKIYRRMIRLWPDKKNKINKFQRKLQYLGLILFQRWYSVFSSNSEWKLYK
jgi:hypothetical protein